MNGHLKTTTVAIAIVLYSLLGSLLFVSLTHREILPEKSIRFAIICFLAFALWKGAGWARWLVGIHAVMAALAPITYIGFSLINGSAPPINSVVAIWSILSAAFYLWVSYMLFLDKDVVSRFRPAGNGISRPG